MDGRMYVCMHVCKQTKIRKECYLMRQNFRQNYLSSLGQDIAKLQKQICIKIAMTA